MSSTVAQLVGRTLADLGIGHAFGVVGSGNFAVTNALIAAGVPFVAARHEGGAATMADAYSRMSELPAVVTTHQGCGLTNALTGIGEAAKSRTPLIVLTADTAGAAVRSNFRIDQDALARSVGAVAERVHSAASAVADTVRAYRTAVRERRTVVLSLPLDVQEAPAPDSWTVPLLPPVQRIRPDVDALHALVSVLDKAQRPVFVAGRGARDAGPQIAALADEVGALVATSAVANGLFEGDPFSLGISGGFSSPLTAELIAGADVIVGWGCALNMWTMRHGSLIGPEATVVQVDIEDSALGANRPIDLGVLGDCRETAAVALERVREGGRGYRSDEVHSRIAAQGRWNDVPFDDLSTATTIDPRLLSRELDVILPRERTVSVDSGNFMGYPSAYLSVPDEFGFCFTQAFQSIGLGLATAVGTALAQPDRLPVAALGDGGFLMGISELETVVRLGLPMVLVVYNDSAYGAEVHHFDSPGTDHSAVTFPDTDIAAIARGYGAEAVTVRSVGDLDAVRAWVASPRTRPLLIDAKVASDGGAWWLAEAFKGH
ncbi:thiamine pyrophosphate-dependent acetolactate synthase large subunit-like protein [Rhodococcus sp. AG1013]|uniref:thiamine pyrophosphate-binding protein n=1 Tax=Rhodococcus sp. AG1013 TaxID=2183996 RepID=UPI000E0BF3D8|nr:thiamine pyrophosphate-binding protein [Rhodococcus sp. AG1013]RDI20488.1 thiamine pyrophosphate-dependent acetolactate synthase large subunit-like protein [Rhodococcus sp. AG1013]